MQVVPKNIFQTHKSKNYVLGKPKVLNAILSWKKFESQYRYYFFDDQDCEKFMKNKMGGDIYKAYCRLPMAVMKADLWRYCVIYYYGGIYADTDTICNCKPDFFINQSLLTMAPENKNNYFCQWVFSAPRNSPILKSVIDLSVKRILEIPEIKGEHIIHHLTGPEVFTDGITEYLQKNNYPTFKTTQQYYRYPHSAMKVFNPEVFHDKIIIHLFTGSDSDGWKEERYEKLM
jgi:mannosyltransferase OCH1-like enzyme